MQIRHQLPLPIGRYALSGAVLGLLLLMYVPLLLHWVDGWLNKSISIEHEYFSHGLIGLPFAAYLAWSNRNRWQQLSDTPHLAGIVLLLLGVACYRSNLTDLINLSLPIILMGLCLWLKGMPGLRLQAFPLLLVFLATPTEIPYLLAPYTLPLQSFIAGTAGFILQQIGMDVRVDQIYLFVNNRIVEVAPYCAGLKMLFTSLYVGLLLLHWTGALASRAKTFWFFAGIIFVSVSANIFRNTLLTFFHGTGREQAFAWLHEGWGGDLYSAAMLGLLVFLLRGIEAWIPDDSDIVDAAES
ncbi:cyanoexosortase B [Oculatella sp. FACHB-28]|uniref:cyanoexosortase B n=1 Tax=Oculatella sp. FACHB-28 TaxID=2692845 RepID=UPI001683CB01|nr:cyanoexosortase B [Oculatella sp. FACHB-28]MBD2058938.1 cyanoexosortase B [Oculatella sp. FACHB-28]